MKAYRCITLVLVAMVLRSLSHLGLCYKRVGMIMRWIKVQYTRGLHARVQEICILVSVNRAVCLACFSLVLSKLSVI